MSYDRVKAFKDAYLSEDARPWDIGRPQKVFVELEKAGQISGSVLDAGCGTGENALYLASKGYEVLGIDVQEVAIERAIAKAKERNLEASFQIADALNLQALGPKFDTVIDSGLYHVFADPEVHRFAESVHSVLVPGGCFFLLTFSDAEKAPGPRPRRVPKTEIYDIFSEGWDVESIEATLYESLPWGKERDQIGGKAWIARIRKKA
jgi:2-polyprenyl-3-methyl-5-hydroxy-6-metoxy-1,4-benzoquinol methylase